ncbi:MAG: luciferase family protein [Bryobacteraceae bacterium]
MNVNNYSEINKHGLSGTGSAGHEAPTSEKPLDAVRAEVARWEGVTTHEHRFGGIEFRLRSRELGHLHATIADLPCPRRIRDELVAAGRARPHHVLPDSGWVTAPMRTAAEVANVITLFRLNYERACREHPSLSGSLTKRRRNQ